MDQVWFVGDRDRERAVHAPYLRSDEERELKESAYGERVGELDHDAKGEMAGWTDIS